MYNTIYIYLDVANNLITNNGAEILLDAMQAQGKIRAIDLSNLIS